MNDSNEVVAADGSVNEQNNITAFVSDAWDELECWLEAEPGQFEPGLTPQRAITAMQNSGWRPPVVTITTVDELQAEHDFAVLHWIDDAGLPHVHTAAYVKACVDVNRLIQGEPMWPMTVIHDGGEV